MKKGFTLLELIVVIIILGVLATLGMQQYFRMVEKSRSAEARQVIGQLREIAAGMYTEKASISTLNVGAVSGLLMGAAPSDCTTTQHYFSYAAVVADPAITFTATRCIGATGKLPSGVLAHTVALATNYLTGSDTWAYGPMYQ